MSSESISHSRKRKLPLAKADRPLEKPRTRRALVDGFLLLQWHELPTWQRNNEFILAGYRPASGSFCQSLRSAGHIHNETVNIYTHVLGAILFAILPFYIYSKGYPRYMNTQLGDIIVFLAFFWSVSVCFLLSASFHIVSNHSATVAALSNHLDYLGIVILMWGSTVPSVYYGFYHEPKLQKLYWLVVTILACACVVATLRHRFHHPNFRPYRAAIYASLGLSAIVFIIHGLVLHGWVIQNGRMSLSWMGLTGGLNLFGAIVYATRIPERWYPGRHDIYGSSHQILHITAIFAGLTHMAGLLSAFHYLHTQS